MTTPQQSQAELAALTGAAVADAAELSSRVAGSPETRRLALLDSVPGVIDYYATGAAALAADFYDERRELAREKRAYATELFIPDRTVKIRRAVAWASEPMFSDMSVTLEQRMSEIVQSEVAAPYRETIIGNRVKDPQSAGWRRVQGDACRFCRMFAAHPNCDCTAEPVFVGQPAGPEASVIQYMASRRNRTPATRKRIRDYLDANYPE
jgi:hypothetical protein